MRRHDGRGAGRGFTLVEMITAVALLVVVILAVGVIFKSASAAVSLSQASSEVFSNVRAMSTQLNTDVSQMSRDGFLVIRSRVVNGRRADLLTFVATGTYRNRCGSANSSNLYGDGVTAPAALLTWGHLVLDTRDPTNQSDTPALTEDPTIVGDKDGVVGRHETLLTPPAPSWSGTAKYVLGDTVDYNAIRYRCYAAAGMNATPPSAHAAKWVPLVAVYSDISRTGATIFTEATASVEPAAHISSSRLCVGAVSVSELMQGIIATTWDTTTPPGVRYGSMARYEADSYCFRFRTLPSVYANATEVTSTTMQLNNAIFRMHPIVLQGCGGFAVEWANLDASQNLVWHGYGLTSAGDATIEPAVANGDVYTAQFSYDSKAKWPVALRVTYRATDGADRLAGGRTFVQVLKVPG